MKCHCGCKRNSKDNWFIEGHPPRSAFRKGQHVSSGTEFQKGNLPWSKGLTKEVDERLVATSEKHIGKRMSKDAREKMSIAAKGRTFSKKTRMKISEAQKGNSYRKGIPHSSETRKKMSKSRLRYCRENEHYATGKTLEEICGPERAKEIKEKQSKARKGKTRIELCGIEVANRMKEEASKRMTGERHWNWQGGASYIPYGKEFDEKLRDKIRRRDRFRCQECYRHQNELERKLAVHHINFIKTDNRKENLISLCLPCHNQTSYDRESWTDYYQDKMLEGGLLG